MLQGKIIRDGSRDYCVKVGSVTVDITDDVRTILAEERTKHERALAEQRAQHADILERYNRIVQIALAGGAGMPTG
jgi:hypothetical protein